MKHYINEISLTDGCRSESSETTPDDDEEPDDASAGRHRQGNTAATAPMCENTDTPFTNRRTKHHHTSFPSGTIFGECIVM